MKAAFSVLVDVVAAGNAVVLSGAGLSTESGIPDYRGPSGQARRAEPMTYQTFVATAAARQRYWARSHLGWRHVAGAAPNAGHHAVAQLERGGLLAGIVTQNVDGLHQAAGARQVIELHGSLSPPSMLPYLSGGTTPLDPPPSAASAGTRLRRARPRAADTRWLRRTRLRRAALLVPGDDPGQSELDVVHGLRAG
jgi:hypothetical protein